MTSPITNRLGQPSTETSKAGAGVSSSPLAPASQSAWWYRATRDQRLAQIDAAMQVGLTAKQVAINCGLPADEKAAKLVRQFAYSWGRAFPALYEKGANAGVTFDAEHGFVHRRKMKLIAAKRAYLHGEPVDFWSAE